MIEIKFQFTSLAAAAAFLADAAGDPRFVPTGALIADGANSAGTTVVSNPSPEAISQGVPKADGKRGPGRPPKPLRQESDSAAPAAAASPASTSAPASEPVVEPPPPAPAKAKTYEETDFADRIMKLVADQKETGNKSKVEALKAALGDLGLKSARELKPEQLDAFGAKLAEIEGVATAATEEALG